MSRGRFITFEGIDGSGKSTQARLLHDRMVALGMPVILTREPGGSEGAEDIRRLLVEGDPDRWSGETECLLFTAARRDHLEKTILPALEAGTTVISDRFADSTRVYQGAVRGALRRLVDHLHAEVIGLEPDLTFVVDMDPTVALSRGLARGSGEDRFEDMGEGFQAALREGFLALADDMKWRCHVIDGGRDMTVIADEIAAIAGLAS